MSTRSGSNRRAAGNARRRRSVRQVGVGLALVVASTLTGMLAITPSTASASASVKPNSTGLIDCNGYSHTQTVVAHLHCADLHGPTTDGNPNGYDGHFYDNGHYIGHDEPSVIFHSSQNGTGNNVTWNETLGKDPSAAPTVSKPGADVTHNFELTVAPWFGLALCDPNSYPQLNCNPNSDANAPASSCLGANPCNAFPGGGSAFQELQLYPPGFAPFADAISCDNTHWCAALTIDSLECTEGFANCNTNCEEPVNFAFIQTDGVPTGPPSPQLSNLSSLSPNKHTLLMNSGDKIQARLFDAPVTGGGHALEAVINDFTTGQRGYMQASGANGFMHTSIVDCSGTPYNFEPEYATAKHDNIIPWAALQGDIISEFEIGHFEACKSVTGNGTFTSGTATDPYHLNCVGPYETEKGATGGDGTGTVEPNDSPCYNKGDTHHGLGGSAPDTVTGCLDEFAAGGDLDFDGSAYWRDWPTSTTPNTFPSTFVQDQPTTSDSNLRYQSFSFQTDLALSESTCTGTSGCAVPPPNAPGKFYPYWTLTSSCQWEFGNNTNGNTFGGPTQEYGTNSIATNGYPEFISQEYANTCA